MLGFTRLDSITFYFGETMTTLRVLLVDDDSMVRQILARMLATYPDLDVVGQAATGDEAVTCVEKLAPHIVIMDIRMPKMDGIAAAREIRAKYPQVQIIGLSEYGNGYNADAMLKAGAVAVYHKSKAPEELYPAIISAGRQDSPS
jgi:DNA-binding NarL/FixJ family response regulator